MQMSMEGTGWNEKKEEKDINSRRNDRESEDEWMVSVDVLGWQ